MLEAIQCYKEDRNCATAYYELAIIYFGGTNGVDLDLEKGAENMSIAASMGLADANMELCHSSYLYWKNHNAAEQEHADAQYNLGFMYANSRGCERDLSKAIEFFSLAAGQGIEEASREVQHLISIQAQEEEEEGDDDDGSDDDDDDDDNDEEGEDGDDDDDEEEEDVE